MLSITNNAATTNADDDKIMIRLVAEGDEAALSQLMQRYKHKLYAFIVRYVKDKDQAYDILQETFIRLHRKAALYDPTYPFATWLYQIAVNQCRDWGRKAVLRRFISLDELANNDDSSLSNLLSDPSADVEQMADYRQQLRIMDREIQRLPHKLKTALILFAIEGHSQEICAELLGISPKSVEMRVYRARNILSKKIVNNFEG